MPNQEQLIPLRVGFSGGGIDRGHRHLPAAAGSHHDGRHGPLGQSGRDPCTAAAGSRDRDRYGLTEIEAPATACWDRSLSRPAAPAPNWRPVSLSCAGRSTSALDGLRVRTTHSGRMLPRSRLAPVTSPPEHAVRHAALRGETEHDMGVDLAQVEESGPGGRISTRTCAGFADRARAHGPRVSPVARRLAEELGADLRSFTAPVSGVVSAVWILTRRSSRTWSANPVRTWRLQPRCRRGRRAVDRGTSR